VSDCDLDERCTGGDSCPTDLFRPLGHVCRGPAGDCDPPETCDGTNRGCPADLLAPTTQLCRRAAAGSAGACDVDDYCDNKNPKCPMDVKQPAGTNCRESAGQCDVPELCDGAQSACPANLFRPMSANFVCRESAGICDRPEVCNGASAQCPPDVFAVGSPCRPIPDDPFAAQCDIAELCENGPECPANAFKMLGFPCDDRSVDTNNDVCGPGGVCSGKCLVDKACNDGQKCTEDTCGVDGRCIFTPIIGCTPDEPARPPVNCRLDMTYRFDFLVAPPVGNSSIVVACGFRVALAVVNGTEVVRTFNNGTERATSFGVISNVNEGGEDAKDAKIRPSTAVTMTFPASWRAAIESVSVSSIGRDTLLAVVRDSPESQALAIAEALDNYDAFNGTRVVYKGVWLVLNPGLQKAPPAVSATPAGSWSVVHARGRPFSLDAVTFTRPFNEDMRQWDPVLDAPSMTTAPSSLSSPGEGESQIGIIVGGVIVGVAVLICAGAGIFYAMTVRKRKQASQQANGVEMSASGVQSSHYDSGAPFPSASNAPFPSASDAAPVQHVIPTKPNAQQTKEALRDKFAQLTSTPTMPAMEGTTAASLLGGGGSSARVAAGYDHVPQDQSGVQYDSMSVTRAGAGSTLSTVRSAPFAAASSSSGGGLQYNALPSGPPSGGPPPRVPPPVSPGRGMPPTPAPRGAGGLGASASASATSQITYNSLADVKPMPAVTYSAL
jgi:hypothetical protein